MREKGVTFLLIRFLWIFILAAPLLADNGRSSGSPSKAREELPRLTELRHKMVTRQIEQRGIESEQVLEAMRTVPRHMFMPEGVRSQAYFDEPVPIGEGQTISQPYIVALMTEQLGLEQSDRVLEIGTGSGYQAAVLAEIVDEVYSIEIKEKLHRRAKSALESLGYDNVTTMHGDGYYGWETHAPFDAIMITAAVDHIPPPLLRQLRNGGKMILPLGPPYGFQDLVLVSKTAEGEPAVEFVTGVIFVPMTGTALE